MIQGDDDIDSLAIRKNDTGFLRRAVRLSWVALILAIIYQCIFFPEIENIIAMVAVVFAWIIATRYVTSHKSLGNISHLNLHACWGLCVRSSISH